VSAKKLPGWVVDDETSIRREVAEWIGLTPAELWRLAQLCSRDVMWAARASGDPQRVLGREDPLPQSTIDALARLRRSTGWGNGDR
jgi:hypothetical protein